MKTDITFKQMDSSDAVKDKINQKMKKISRYGLDAMECHVTLSAESYLQKAEVVVRAKNFRTHGVGATGDIYASIEQAFAKVEKTIRRHHDRKIRRIRHLKATAAA